MKSPFLQLLCFYLPDKSNQTSFPSAHLNTVILPAMSRTTQVLKPIYVSLGDAKIRDSSLSVVGWHG